MAEPDVLPIALARIAALESLLVCYRTGSRPSEKLHSELARTKTALAEALDGFSPSGLTTTQ